MYRYPGTYSSSSGLSTGAGVAGYTWPGMGVAVIGCSGRWMVGILTCAGSRVGGGGFAAGDGGAGSGAAGRPDCVGTGMADTSGAASRANPSARPPSLAGAPPSAAGDVGSGSGRSCTRPGGGPLEASAAVTGASAAAVTIDATVIPAHDVHRRPALVTIRLVLEKRA